VRREEPDGVVSPVVAQSLFLQERVVDELMDGHELQCGDAELFQVFDHRGVREAGVGSANLWRHVLVEVGHAAHVGFVDDRIMVWRVRMLVVAPVKIGVDDCGLHGVIG